MRTGTFNDHRLGMVQNTVENGGGERSIVVKDRAPVLVGFVGRNHRRTQFVAFAKDLEEQVCAEFVE